ncbi:MAG: ABC transporter permease [Actinomycetia bacterium]|nr:ABC transporter permease [Actinomycetes bacterium]
MIGLLIATSIVTFALFNFGPADPAADSCGKACSPERIVEARVALGMNKPLVTQYLEYMRGIVMGRHMGAPSARYWCSWPCFGTSFRLSNTPVWSLMKTAIPYTVSLAIGAAIIWLIVGVLLGIAAGLHRGKLIDRIAVGFSSIGVSMPVPVLGMLLMLVFCVTKVIQFPSSRTNAPWGPGGPLGFLDNFILPWTTLAILFMASYVRITRTSILETMGEDYIRTARAKGLRPRLVTFKHGLRAAITPIVTMFGMDLGAVLGGAVLTETIFGLPGLGQLSVNAVNNEDLPIIMSVVLFAAFFIIVANIVVDIVYALIDPRVRLQ